MIGLKFGRMITATAILVCLAVFLYACGKGAETQTTEPTFPEPWSEAQVFTMPTEPQEPASDDAGADETSDEETALRRIEAAHAVFGLFVESRPQLDKEDSVEIEQGLVAYRVADEHFDTMEKLQ